MQRTDGRTVNDEDGDGDDACCQVAGNTLVDAVVRRRDVNDRQVSDILQRPRRRRKVAEYLYAEQSWQIAARQTLQNVCAEKSA